MLRASGTSNFLAVFTKIYNDTPYNFLNFKNKNKAFTKTYLASLNYKFILSIAVWKASFLHLSIRILNRETFTFLSLIVFSILDNIDLLTAFPFGNKDETASGLRIYCKLPTRRRRFSSWLSSTESLVNMIRRPMDSFR